VRRFGWLWCVLAIALPGRVDGITIGLYSDLDCTSCNLDLAPGSFGIFYVAIKNDELTIAPIGAEFRITGLPLGWSPSAMPNPALQTIIGDPLQNGVNVRFASGLVLACVRLYSVQIRVPPGGGQARLRVEAHGTPSNPNFTCPVIDLDLPPLSPRVCAGGGHLLINSPLACTVGVEPQTWSQVKRLFE
jgi:hypothetical protein